jgi:hypothetical protein
MSFTSKLGDDFLRVPKLSSDGRNWVIYKDRLTLSVVACGLDGHLDGSITRPDDPPTRKGAATLTKDEVSANEIYEKELRDWNQKQAIVFQQIASTIPDSLYLKIRGKSTVKAPVAVA